VNPPTGPVRWLLVAVSLFVALGALPVGVGFVVKPDGSMVGMPLSVLRGTPFVSFRIPGFFLAFAVGGSTLSAAILAGRRHPEASLAALVAGAIVVGWIGTQVLLIGLVSVLQPVIAIAGLALLALGAVSRRR
jgi:hypothetical protein